MAEVFKIEGLAECEQALMELPKSAGKTVLKRALKKAAKPIRDEAASNAPVLSGHLKASIAATDKLTRRQKADNHPESAVEIYVGAGGLPQAHLQEFGTSEFPAQPFLRPAWDNNRMAALDSIKQSIWDEIEKARQRLARKAERIAAKIKAGA